MASLVQRRRSSSRTPRLSKSARSASPFHKIKGALSSDRALSRVSSDHGSDNTLVLSEDMNSKKGSAKKKGLFRIPFKRVFSRSKIKPSQEIESKENRPSERLPYILKGKDHAGKPNEMQSESYHDDDELHHDEDESNHGADELGHEVPHESGHKVNASHQHIIESSGDDRRHIESVKVGNRQIIENMDDDEYSEFSQSSSESAHSSDSSSTFDHLPSSKLSPRVTLKKKDSLGNLTVQSEVPSVEYPVHREFANVLDQLKLVKSENEAIEEERELNKFVSREENNDERPDIPTNEDINDIHNRINHRHTTSRPYNGSIDENGHRREQPTVPQENDDDVYSNDGSKEHQLTTSSSQSDQVDSTQRKSVSTGSRDYHHTRPQYFQSDDSARQQSAEGNTNNISSSNNQQKKSADATTEAQVSLQSSYPLPSSTDITTIGNPSEETQNSPNMAFRLKSKSKLYPFDNKNEVPERRRNFAFMRQGSPNRKKMSAAALEKNRAHAKELAMLARNPSPNQQPFGEKQKHHEESKPRLDLQSHIEKGHQGLNFAVFDSESVVSGFSSASTSAYDMDSLEVPDDGSSSILSGMSKPTPPRKIKNKLDLFTESHRKQHRDITQNAENGGRHENVFHPIAMKQRLSSKKNLSPSSDVGSSTASFQLSGSGGSSRRKSRNSIESPSLVSTHYGGQGASAFVSNGAASSAGSSVSGAAARRLMRRSMVLLDNNNNTSNIGSGDSVESQYSALDDTWDKAAFTEDVDQQNKRPPLSPVPFMPRENGSNRGKKSGSIANSSVLESGFTFDAFGLDANEIDNEVNAALAELAAANPDLSLFGDQDEHDERQSEASFQSSTKSAFGNLALTPSSSMSPIMQQQLPLEHYHNNASERHSQSSSVGYRDASFNESEVHNLNTHEEVKHISLLGGSQRPNNEDDYSVEEESYIDSTRVSRSNVHQRAQTGKPVSLTRKDSGIEGVQSIVSVPGAVSSIRNRFKAAISLPDITSDDSVESPQSSIENKDGRDSELAVAWKMNDRTTRSETLPRNSAIHAREVKYKKKHDSTCVSPLEKGQQAHHANDGSGAPMTTRPLHVRPKSPLDSEPNFVSQRRAREWAAERKTPMPVSPLLVPTSMEQASLESANRKRSKELNHDRPTSPPVKEDHSFGKSGSVSDYKEASNSSSVCPTVKEDNCHVLGQHEVYERKGPVSDEYKGYGSRSRRYSGSSPSEARSNNSSSSGTATNPKRVLNSVNKRDASDMPHSIMDNPSKGPLHLQNQDSWGNHSSPSPPTETDNEVQQTHPIFRKSPERQRLPAIQPNENIILRRTDSPVFDSDINNERFKTAAPSVSLRKVPPRPPKKDSPELVKKSNFLGKVRLRKTSVQTTRLEKDKCCDETSLSEEESTSSQHSSPSQNSVPSQHSYYDSEGENEAPVVKHLDLNNEMPMRKLTYREKQELLKKEEKAKQAALQHNCSKDNQPKVRDVASLVRQRIATNRKIAAQNRNLLEKRKESEGNKSEDISSIRQQLRKIPRNSPSGPTVPDRIGSKEKNQYTPPLLQESHHPPTSSHEYNHIPTPLLESHRTPPPTQEPRHTPPPIQESYHRPLPFQESYHTPPSLQDSRRAEKIIEKKPEAERPSAIQTENHFKGDGSKLKSPYSRLKCNQLQSLPELRFGAESPESNDTVSPQSHVFLHSTLSRSDETSVSTSSSRVSAETFYSGVTSKVSVDAVSAKPLTSISEEQIMVTNGDSPPSNKISALFAKRNEGFPSLTAERETHEENYCLSDDESLPMSKVSALFTQRSTSLPLEKKEEDPIVSNDRERKENGNFLALFSQRSASTKKVPIVDDDDDEGMEIEVEMVQNNEPAEKNSPPNTGGRPALKDDPAYAKYFKMLKMGLPTEVVKHAMARDGMDGDLLDGDHNKPVGADENSVALEDDPQYEKYFKMLKLGLPMGAVKNAMERDGEDPTVMDGDHKAPALGKNTIEPKEKEVLPKDNFRRTRLHWDTLGKVRSTSVWALVNKDPDVEKIVIDENEFAELFQAKMDPKGISSQIDTNSGKSRNAVKVIDPKRANNGGIILARLKLTYDEMAMAVDKIEESVMTAEQIQGLIEYIPTKEEKQSLRKYMTSSGKDSSILFEELCECEKFMVAMMTVKHSKEKVRAMLFKLQFQQCVADLEKETLVVQQSCDELLRSVRLRQLLGIVLNIGNRLNTAGPTRKGKAGAFTMKSLLKLNQAKAFDKKTTFLHYVVLVVQRHDEILSCFKDDLPNVLKADKIFWDQCVSDLEEVENQLENVRKIALHEVYGTRQFPLTKRKKKSCEDEEMSHESMTLEEEVEALRASTIGLFTLDAIKAVSSLRENVEQTNIKFTKVLEYFGEEGRNKMQPHDLFGIIVRFSKDFDLAKEEVAKDNKLKVSSAFNSDLLY